MFDAIWSLHVPCADVYNDGVSAVSWLSPKGLPAVRDSVCHYIETRDNLSHVDPENIYLTNGASAGIAAVLQLLVSNEGDGVMIPIPQYPLYTATLALLGATPVPYYPDEAKVGGTRRTHALLLGTAGYMQGCSTLGGGRVIDASHCAHCLVVSSPSCTGALHRLVCTCKPTHDCIRPQYHSCYTFRGCWFGHPAVLSRALTLQWHTGVDAVGRRSASGGQEQ